MIVAPALTFFSTDGDLDLRGNETYARALGELDLDVLLLGSTGEGETLTDAERAALIELHAAAGHRTLTVVLPHSVSTCVAEAASSVACLMHAPWPTRDRSALARFHRASGGSWMLYSHPDQTPLPLTLELAHYLTNENALPAGAKVSKAAPELVAELRRLFGPSFRLWHGTDRDIAASVEAGADAVVSQAVAALGVPDVRAPGVQARIDAMRPSQPDKLRALKALAIQRLSCGTTNVRE